MHHSGRRMPVGGALPVVCAILFAACGGSGADGGAAQGGAAEGELTGTLEIGAPVAKTGAAGFIGEAEEEGMRFAVEQINTQGFLGDAKISLSVDDTGDQVNQAVSVVRDYASGGMPVVVGITLSNQALAAIPVLESGSTPFVLIGSGVDLQSVPGGVTDVYTLDPPQQSYAPEKLVPVLAEKDVKSVAFINDKSNPGITGYHDALVEEVLPKEGIEVKEDLAVTGEETDFGPSVTAAIDADPDAIGVFLRGKAAITAITAIRRAGYEGQIFGQAGLANGAAAGAAPLTNGVFFNTTFAPEVLEDVPSSQAFIDAWTAEKGSAPGAFHAQGYDGVWLAARAAKAAGCITRECLRQGLEEVTQGEVPAALGLLTFEDGEAGFPGAIIEIKDGAETPIK